MYSAPLLPLLELPVLSTRRPLTPALPELDVFMTNAPLLVAVPRPVMIEIAPPVAEEETPAAIAISPPGPLLPEPTVT